MLENGGGEKNRNKRGKIGKGRYESRKRWEGDGTEAGKENKRQ